MKRTICVLSLTAVLFLTASCAFINKVAQNTNQGEQVYSDINMAYKDKSEMSIDINVFKRTAAGFLDYLDSRDEEGLKRLLCDALLDRTDTEADLDGIFENFKGTIVETTNIASDTEAGLPGHYDGGFYVTTTEETYYVYLVVTVTTRMSDLSEDEEDLLGINQIHFMTLDKKYELKVDKTEYWDFINSHPDGVGHRGDSYNLTYTFGDGEVKTVSCDRLAGGDCYIVTSFGNSEGYAAINTLLIGSRSYVWKLTGTDDSISAEELEAIDFTDAETAHQVFDALEPYAIPDMTYYHDADFRFYNLSDRDSNMKAYVYYGTDTTFPRVRIFDLDKIFAEQDWN